MNIFFVHEDPVVAASMLCDVHCNKMVLESAQMLANCFSYERLAVAPYTQSGKPRKYSHYNHPSSVWVRQSKANMRWLLDHALALESERIKRGYNRHFVFEFLIWVNDHFDESLVPDGPLTKFAVAISKDAECRVLPFFDDLPIVKQYRAYYNWDKSGIATWKLGNTPEWYKGRVGATS